MAFHNHSIRRRRNCSCQPGKRMPHWHNTYCRHIHAHTIHNAPHLSRDSHTYCRFRNTPTNLDILVCIFRLHTTLAHHMHSHTFRNYRRRSSCRRTSSDTTLSNLRKHPSWAYTTIQRMPHRYRMQHHMPHNSPSTTSYRYIRHRNTSHCNTNVHISSSPPHNEVHVPMSNHPNTHWPTWQRKPRK